MRRVFKISLQINLLFIEEEGRGGEKGENNVNYRENDMVGGREIERGRGRDREGEREIERERKRQREREGERGRQRDEKERGGGQGRRAIQSASPGKRAAQSVQNWP